MVGQVQHNPEHTGRLRPPAGARHLRARAPRWSAVLGLALLLAAVVSSVARAAEADDGAVHVAGIRGPIDLGLAPYLDRVLDDAADAGAAAVLLEIDTPGGRLDAVLQMQDALVDTPVRTIAFVEGRALSAGALVAIASDEAYVAPGATLGAATPVLDGGEPADAKTVSAVRATFAATAQATGRDPQTAEAMVDPDVAVDGLVGSGELLTLTAEQAVDIGYAAGLAADRAAVLDAAGLASAPVVETAPRPAESLARLLTHPAVASLLVTVAILLLIADLAIGGIGITSVFALGAFALFFWGHLVAGLAGWEELALVAVGLTLIVVEVLVVPGLGLPGLLGLAALVGGLSMAQLSRDLVTSAQLQRAAVVGGVALTAVIVGLLGAVRLLLRYGPAHALVLDTQLGSGKPVTERATGGWVRWFGGNDLVLAGGERDPESDEWDDERALDGRRGIAVTALRPSGLAEIDGARVDVVTSGEYVSAGEPVEVVRDDGYRRVVRRWSAVDDAGPQPT